MNTSTILLERAALQPEETPIAQETIAQTLGRLPETRTTLSILTASFNRTHTLGRVFQTLKAQSFKDFEWLIMDDGSTDETQELVLSWPTTSLKFTLYQQENRGKHRALNALIPKAKGDFILILDSDDYLLPTALEQLLKYWFSIPEHDRDNYSGVSALCANSEGKVQGKAFQKSIIDSNDLEMNYVLGYKCERRGFIRTEILQRHLFPEFAGESFVPESIVWHQIGRHYKTRYIREVICTMDYLEDGFTQNIRQVLINNPKGTASYYKNLVARKLPIKIQLGGHAYYVRYALHAKSKLTEILTASKQHLFLLTGGTLGLLLYLYDLYNFKAKHFLKKALRSKKYSSPSKQTRQTESKKPTDQDITFHTDYIDDGQGYYQVTATLKHNGLKHRSSQKINSLADREEVELLKAVLMHELTRNLPDNLNEKPVVLPTSGTCDFV